MGGGKAVADLTRRKDWSGVKLGQFAIISRIPLTSSSSVLKASVGTGAGVEVAESLLCEEGVGVGILRCWLSVRLSSVTNKGSIMASFS
jgi:hypothetical protein